MRMNCKLVQIMITITVNHRRLLLPMWRALEGPKLLRPEDCDQEEPCVVWPQALSGMPLGLVG